jgi:hypothetical protein
MSLSIRPRESGGKPRESTSRDALRFPTCYEWMVGFTDTSSARLLGCRLFANLLGVNGARWPDGVSPWFAWLATLKFDLNSLHEKFGTVSCKHSRNSGER